MPQVRSGSIDAVVCAHSFHWFATEEAMKEIHRVLKPGGRLGLIWNLRDASVDWVGQLAAIVTAEAGENPRYYSGDWRKVFPYAGFSLSTEKHFPHLHTGSPEDVIINRIKSISFIASKTPEEQAVIFDKVRHLIATHPALVNKESISVPYDTVAFHAAKILPL
jgi:SAM-dependent methyltransferase